MELGFCPNRERIRELQATLGKLQRIDTLGESEWGLQDCSPVHPYNKNHKSDGQTSMHQVQENSRLYESKSQKFNNSRIVVEKVADDFAHKAAALVHLTLDDGDPMEYIDEVKEFGFDHIIIIGNRYCGVLFLDCFGRVFELDMMSGVLWALGNSLEEASVIDISKGRVAWGVNEDGTIEEFVVGKFMQFF
jgi:hypothetical protein